MQAQVKEGNVFLGSITHNGLLEHRMARIFFNHASNERYMQTLVHQTSLLASACNFLWCTALNGRQAYNFKWFVLLHADIVPEEWFVDKLIAIAEQHDADLLSAIVPIKEQSGVTSTAISGPDEFIRTTRLTMKQINHPDMPETFTVREASEFLLQKHDINVPADSKLLVNTGCMVARLDREWCSQVNFTIRDRVVQELGGIYTSQVEPEDWYFSRRVAECGGKVMATRAIKTQHIGSIPYLSNKVWGDDVDRATVYN
jgi:GT2 family glycosyltransferase